MNYQLMKDERIKRPQKISTTLNKVTKNFTSKLNKREYIIYAKWGEMVGSFFTEYTDPVRVENIKNNSELFDQNFTDGILHINIHGSAALEFQHFKDKIIEKINSFFGYKAISRIVLHQVPHLEKRQKISKNNEIKKKLNTKQENDLKKTTFGVKSKKLEKTLFKLGKSILVEKDQ